MTDLTLLPTKNKPLAKLYDYVHLPFAQSIVEYNENRYFTKMQAARLGANIIDAAVMHLFKENPARYSQFADIFLNITTQERQQASPLLLERLMQRTHFIQLQDEQLKSLQTILTNLKRLWLSYKHYIEQDWQKIQDEVSTLSNIELTKHATRDLVALLIERRYARSHQSLFEAENDALHLIGRDSVYTTFTNQGKTFFHAMLPVNTLTEPQLQRELAHYPFLDSLTLEHKKRLVSQVRPCYKRYAQEQDGLANFFVDILGELKNGELLPGMITTQHASFVPAKIKDPELRLSKTIANVEQWLTQIADNYLLQHKVVDANICLQAATCSLLSPLPGWLDHFDSNHELQQVTDIAKAISHVNENFSLTRRVNNTTVNFRFKASYTVHGVNQLRGLAYQQVQAINDQGYHYLCNTLNKRWNLTTGFMTAFLNLDKQQALHYINELPLNIEDREIYKLYMTFRWLYANQDFSAEQNYHLPVLNLLLNQYLSIPCELACVDSKDRSARTKIMLAAYLEFYAQNQRYPNWFDLNDRMSLKGDEQKIQHHLLYTQIAPLNTPGLTGMRLYATNSKLAKLAVKCKGYGGDLNDGNTHLANVKLNHYISKELGKNRYKQPGFWQVLKQACSNFWCKLRGQPVKSLAKYLHPNDVKDSELVVDKARVRFGHSKAEKQLKNLLGLTESAQDATLAKSQYVSLARLRLIDHLAITGKFSLTDNNRQAIAAMVSWKQALLSLNHKIKQADGTKVTLTQHECELVNDLLDQEKLQTCLSLFNLAQPNQGQEVIKNCTSLIKLQVAVQDKPASVVYNSKSLHSPLTCRHTIRLAQQPSSAITLNSKPIYSM